MRLFGYYVLHAFKNQLKKLFKTWVLVFSLVCLVMGVGLGLLGAVLGGDEEEPETPPEEEIQDGEGFLEAAGITQGEFVELIAGAGVLLMFTFCALNADKSGANIFQPADVNLLFAAPMRPQSVLMFRLGTQMGVGVLGSVYMLFQLPNLILNLGLRPWAALSLAAAWGLTAVCGMLLRMALYLLAATYPAVKRWLRRGIYLLLALIALGFAVFARARGGGLLKAASLFFNGRGTRFIPFWGWIKGLCGFAAREEPAGALVCLLAVFLGGAALIALIWRMKADFYEDAMAKSEETAELMAAMNAEKSAPVAVRGGKPRSERIARDGTMGGWGANVYFHKTMYNRRRFAHWGFLTKTMETYLVAALALGAVLRFAAHVSSVTPIALALAALAFFRALGDPLGQDAQTDLFSLIPESTWAKVFWSLAGGTVCCLLDVLPAMVLGALAVGGDLLTALLWVPVIVSVDFYTTTVGDFIGFSTPDSAGKLIKQLVQILFVYFGLVPDIIVAALCLSAGRPHAAMLAVTALNAALGLVFFGLAPLFIDPKGGSGDALRRARRHFSRLGLGALVMLVTATVLQALAMGALLLIYPQGEAPGWIGWMVWVVTFVPMYLVAIPLGVLVMRRVPASPPEKRPLRAGELARAGVVCVFLMYAGNLLGNLILALLGQLVGQIPENPLTAYTGNLVMQILVMVIVGPLIEEYVFRKTLIDRMRVYGGRVAVVTSALMFGLFHGNLSQFFYAFALGLVFGYLYLRTGRLRWSAGAHMVINLLGGVVAPSLLDSLDLQALETADMNDTAALLELGRQAAPFVVYALVMFALAIAGLVVFCARWRKTSFDPEPLELGKGERFRTVFLNPGMLLFVAACLLSIAATFLPV